MAVIYRMDSVSKSYSTGETNIKVLEKLSLEIISGDTIAITGKSGSGKSTLLHILGLLDAPDSGRLFYKEKEISTNIRNIETFRNKHIGFVFQFHYLMADFTTIENVAMPAAISGHPWKKAKVMAKSILEKMDMSSRLNHFPNQLSGGEQQRVAIARALINKPDIIIADEPTGNLDKGHSDDIIALFKNLNEEFQQTLILATHDVEIACSMKNHYVLENGTLLHIRNGI